MLCGSSSAKVRFGARQLQRWSSSFRCVLGQLSVDCNDKKNPAYIPKLRPRRDFSLHWASVERCTVPWHSTGSLWAVHVGEIAWIYQNLKSVVGGGAGTLLFVKRTLWLIWRLISWSAADENKTSKSDNDDDAGSRSGSRSGGSQSHSSESESEEEEEEKEEEEDGTL